MIYIYIGEYYTSSTSMTSSSIIHILLASSYIASTIIIRLVLHDCIVLVLSSY